jgi:hypothetical protein
MPLNDPPSIALRAGPAAGDRQRHRRNFRVVNDRVAWSSESDVFKLLCECGDPACLETVDVPVRQFHRVRLHPDRFIVSARHEPTLGPLIVERHGTWSVISDSTEY